MGLQNIAAFVKQDNSSTAIQHPVELWRNMIDRATSRPGLSRPGDFGETGTTVGTVVPGAMQLTLPAGAMVLGGAQTNAQQGKWFAWSDASETISWPAAGGSNRMDSLIARVADPQYGTVSGTVDGYWDAVAGSSASARPDSDFLSGGAKYVPGAWLRVADVLVPASATQLTQVNVTFKAGFANMMGYTPAVSTLRPTGLYDGELMHELDTGRRFFWSASAAAWLPVMQLLDAYKITATDPYQSAFAFGSETAITRMTHTLPSIRSGELLRFSGQAVYLASVTDTEHSLILRKDTAVTGTLVGAARIGRPPDTNGHPLNWEILYAVGADATNVNFYYSAHRTAGTGTLALYGQESTGQMGVGTVESLGPSSKYRTVT